MENCYFHGKTQQNLSQDTKTTDEIRMGDPRKAIHVSKLNLVKLFIINFFFIFENNKEELFSGKAYNIILKGRIKPVNTQKCSQRPPQGHQHFKHFRDITSTLEIFVLNVNVGYCSKKILH